MYNRYVPQSDGTFQRCRINDTPAKPQPPHKEPPCPPFEPECSLSPPPKPAPRPCSRPKPRPQRTESRQEPQGGNVFSFFRQLLPRDFDTGDLLVVILLLLMSSDCQEDQNTALLTLALYPFL